MHELRFRNNFKRRSCKANRSEILQSVQSPVGIEGWGGVGLRFEQIIRSLRVLCSGAGNYDVTVDPAGGLASRASTWYVSKMLFEVNASQCMP